MAPDAVDGAGPLSGLVGLLEALETPFLLAVPCDQPLLPPDLGDRLLACIKGVDAVLLSVGGRIEPFPVLLSGELRPLLADLLRGGERRADAWVDRAPCALVPLEELYPGLEPGELLLNVNDDEALSLARERLGLASPRVEGQSSD